MEDALVIGSSGLVTGAVVERYSDQRNFADTDISQIGSCLQPEVNSGQSMPKSDRFSTLLVVH